MTEQNNYPTVDQLTEQDWVIFRLLMAGVSHPGAEQAMMGNYDYVKAILWASKKYGPRTFDAACKILREERKQGR